MSKARKWLIGAGVGLVGLAVLTWMMANRMPRGHLSQGLKFLAGVAPVSSTYEDQNRLLDPRSKQRGQSVLVENFDLPQSFATVHEEARKELKPRCYVATSHPEANPPNTLYGIADEGKHVVVTIIGIDPTHTAVRFVTPIYPGPLDRFLGWIRNAGGGRGAGEPTTSPGR